MRRTDEELADEIYKLAAWSGDSQKALLIARGAHAALTWAQGEYPTIATTTYLELVEKLEKRKPSNAI